MKLIIDIPEKRFITFIYGHCGNEYCEHSDRCGECNSRIIDKYDVDNTSVVVETLEQKGGVE